MKEDGNRFKGSRSQSGFSLKEAPFLKPASQGPFSNDDPMLIGEPFYELLVGMDSETLFNFFSEGLQIDRWESGCERDFGARRLKRFSHDYSVCPDSVPLCA